MNLLKKHKEFVLVFTGIGLLIVLCFYPVFWHGKILFPSNLAISAFAPWRYEPVPEYPSGPPNKPLGFDNIRQFFPNRKFLRESLTSWSIPLWNPYIYSGTPFMAAFDTAVWYPLSWLAALFPVTDGWNVLVIVQPILSMIFMYLLLRSLKFTIGVSLVGSGVYAFSGWMVVYWQEILVLEHSFLWLPLALYASNKIWADSESRMGIILLVCSLCFSVFGGFLQMFLYVFSVVILWNVYRYLISDRKQRDIEIIRKIVYLLFTALLVSSIQLIPSIEAFLQSPRGLSDGKPVFENYLVPISHLITLIAPDFWGNPGTYNYFGGKAFYFEKMIFIGLVPLFFALYELFSKNSKNTLFWKIMAVFALSMGFTLPTSWLPYYLRIPVLSNSYPTRIFSVYMLASVILCCYGLSSYLRSENRRRTLQVICTVSTVFIIAWMIVAGAICSIKNPTSHAFICSKMFSPITSFFRPFSLNQEVLYASVSMRNLLLPSIVWLIVCITVLQRMKNKKILLFILGAVIAVSQAYFIKKYVFFSERKFVYPSLPVTEKITALSGYNRVWGYGNAYIEKNLPQYFRWYSTDGYGNLSPLRYARLLSSIKNNGLINPVIRRSDTDIFEASEWDSFGSANPYRLRMMALLGVRYILESKKGELKDKRTTEERFPSNLFSLVWEDPVWRIWQYKDVIPRINFISHYQIRTKEQDIIDALYSKDTDLRRTVILEDQPDMTSFSGTVNATIDILKYSPDRVELSVQSDRDGLVFITDNFYPGWRASVDGKNVPIFRADYSFRAIPVTSGRHRITMIYFPISLIFGLIVTSAGIMLFVYSVWKVRQNR